MDQMTGSAGNNTSHCPSIDDFRNQVYSTAYSIITVFGLMGNGFALVVLIRTFRQSSPFHVYMLNLAVSDILCVSTLPLRILYYVNKGQWDLGDFLCRISAFALYVNLYCSIFFMAAMSVTRFLAIVFPVQNLRLTTICRARLVCVCIWMFVCIASSPFLLTGQHIDRKTGKTKCFEPPSGPNLKNLLILNYLAFVLGFALPFLIILICYVGIIRTLLSRNHSARRNRANDTKAIRMIVIVMLAFLISFMPYHVQRSIHLSFLFQKGKTCEEQVAMQKFVVVTLCLAASNSCFDPLLYFFSGEGFRTRLMTLHKSTKVRGLQQSAKFNTAAEPGSRKTKELM
ncbi:cysteinyl leukotriene receptor 1 [Lampris incognitus]|uniref:cysteinyl leukotriene receptor 1 n=1 Tax=Lampris incognitus TaxID=2546036 RepID=UPI0024B60E8F|nr:cysteinyl leukotriene receptor 1 [Lampris incognitus]XP_056146647.1 cysteinyl leukotriene receptor 1 [Lampris incognitus]XP_056146657.1 cysteinyl leukotriene receptor 1 [Lampris incognitus]XP_056146667.1 cysteinyl leukotriene receptor 1 [Lampris incognitus]